MCCSEVGLLGGDSSSGAWHERVSFSLPGSALPSLLSGCRDMSRLPLLRPFYHAIPINLPILNWNLANCKPKINVLPSKLRVSVTVSQWQAKWLSHGGGVIRQGWTLRDHEAIINLINCQLPAPPSLTEGFSILGYLLWPGYVWL